MGRAPAPVSRADRRSTPAVVDLRDDPRDDRTDDPADSRADAAAGEESPAPAPADVSSHLAALRRSLGTNAS